MPNIFAICVFSTPNLYTPLTAGCEEPDRLVIYECYFFQSRTTECHLPSPFRQPSRECLHSLGMHAESHLEVIENKEEGSREGSVDFVKFAEIENTVNSLDV